MKKIMMKKRIVIAIIAMICCIPLFVILSLMPSRMACRMETVSMACCVEGNPMAYRMEEAGGEYRVSVYNYKGEMLYKDAYLREPRITPVGKHTMMVTEGAGDACSSIFINEKTGEISEAYDVAAACSEQLIVYGTYEDGQMKIIIRNIYDKDKCYKEITDTFADTAVGHYLIKDAEIIGDFWVCITYYVDDWEEKSIRLFFPNDPDD